MPNLKNDMSNIKLCVMYMLRALATEVTAPQLTVSLIEAVDLQYFDIQLAISELEDTGQIASVAHPYGTCYGLTEKGSSTLLLKEKTIPRSMRSACEDYAFSNRLDMMRSEQMSAYSRKNPAGGYDAVLSSFDTERVVLSVVVNVPDKTISDRMCEQWQKKSHQVYSAIFDELL